MCSQLEAGGAWILGTLTTANVSGETVGNCDVLLGPSVVRRVLIEKSVLRCHEGRAETSQENDEAVQY